jgi:RNA polymerase sigma factor (sigma-70 family)
MADADRTHPSFLHRLRDSADPASWHEFHEKYGHTLYRYARSLGAAHADAEDVVQDVEMQFFQAIGGFAYDAQRGRLRSYLRSAVLHALRRRISRRARQPAELNPQRLESLMSEDGSQQDETWEREWQLHRLRRAVQEVADEFDPPTLKAFEMHVLAGRAADEAATALEMSKWSVYRASNRVLARVREKLAEFASNDDP